MITGRFREISQIFEPTSQVQVLSTIIGMAAERNKIEERVLEMADFRDELADMNDAGVDLIFSMLLREHVEGLTPRPCTRVPPRPTTSCESLSVIVFFRFSRPRRRHSRTGPRSGGAWIAFWGTKFVERSRAVRSCALGSID